MYSSLLANFEEWLIQSRGRNIDIFTSNDVADFRDSRESADTANSFLAAIRGYCRFRVGELEEDDPDLNKEIHRLTRITNLPRKRRTKKLVKVALEPEELRGFINKMKRNAMDEQIIAGVIVHFYFGNRPIEFAHPFFVKKMRIDWEKNEMIALTAKTRDERYLAWHPNLTPYLETWLDGAPYLYPSEYITKHIRHYTINGLKMTAKVARKTVQTQMRLGKIPDYIIDAILGHVSKTSAIGDIYTDFTQVMPRVKDVMTNKHYMILNKII